MGIIKKARQDKNNFGTSAILNQASYHEYYERLMEISISYFKWENLPPTCNARYLETILFRNGSCLFFKDDVMGFLNLQWTNQGSFDVYHIPLVRRAFSENGYNYVCSNNDSVIIYNNLLHNNFDLDIKLFATRLYLLDRIIDVNCNAQRTPVMITCSEEQRLTLLNLYKQYEGNVPFIFGNKGLDIDAVKALQTGAPYLADKLYELKTRIWSEAMTYLGITNIPFEKKEHLIRREIEFQDNNAAVNRYSRLAARQEACEEINRMFGLNISCDIREKSENPFDVAEKTELGESEVE